VNPLSGKILKTNHKITAAVLAALGAHGACFAADAADSGASDSDLNGVQEVTVTAQRRTESVQDVPITIQAITGDQLKQLNVTSFDDVVKYLPNVSFGANGPGQGEIYMRGLSAGPAAGEQSSASILPFPNVAVYLDDQSVQFPGRNLDIYMADMERIEVLEGPQGTLFGGGAEAGAIRYITNKPNLTKTEGDLSAMYGTTAHGDPNQSVQGMLNVPVIEGTFALRGVIYDERRGGYIDNVPSTFTRSNNDPGSTGQLQYTPPGGKCANGQPAGTGGYCVPSYDVQGNNFGQAGNAQNPTTYGGIRVEALWQVNDDWSALLSQSYQNMEADGSPAQYPYGSDYMVNPSAPQQLGPWEGTFFTPIYDKDRFENTALTINGKVGDLNLVYSGAYLIRHVDQTGDYTNYARSGSGYYYDCSGPNTQNKAPVAQCYSPVMAWHDQTRNSHISNELRMSTPDNWLVRGLLGLYQENFTIADNMNFQYNNLPGCTAANLATTSANAAAGNPDGVCVGQIGPVPSSNDLDPNPRPSTVNYGEDERRGYSQYAFFTSVDVDLIPKVLTLTGGTRYYHYQEYEFGTRYDGNCVNQTVCTPIYGGGNIIDPPDTSYHGFRSRGNLTWHITSDIMAYYTFSQGFRPGGFNRFSSLKFGDVPVCANGSTPTAGSAATACAGTKATAGAAQYQNSYSYAPDTLTNNEIGFKTEWLDHRVQFNASLYDMEWKNAQFVFFDPTDGFGSSNFVTNGPNYRIKGVEIQLVTRPIDGLTVQGSSSWNSSEQENAVCLPVNNPALSNYGQCISQTIKSGTVNNITSPLGEPGSRPAFSPPMQFSLLTRYDWNLFHDYKAFISAGASHTGGMFNQPAGYPTPGVGSTPLYPATSVRERFYQPGYTTYDASGGVSKDRWTVTVYGQNLSNSDASTYTNTAQYIEQQVPLRPRVLGLRVDYKF
jgi:iron complex outermembrane recepter protein